MRELEIFIDVLAETDSSARAARLDRACGDDITLRERVERLLAEHQRAEDVSLDAPPPVIDATLQYEPVAERPGSIIGPYKLLQQIGEGGMGVVFMAEQSVPIHRTVALKIIKPGMDTHQVIARFEAERQALAMMDHPNIAKVLDAGTTGAGSHPEGTGQVAASTDDASLQARRSPLPAFSGRPYFVMELVKGIPITRYCDEKQLSLR